MPSQQCDFCHRPANEVKILVGNPPKTPLICNRCLEASHRVLQKQSKGRSETKPEKTVPIPKPKEIVAELNRHVISQTSAKRVVASAIYDHFKRRRVVQEGIDLGVEISKSNILLLGPSGTGKTEIARSVARILKVPFYVSDVSGLTQAGYVGDDVESILQGLLADCDGNISRAEWGIVFLDELDKIGRKSGRGSTGYRDVTGEGVQQQLLKLVEGHKVRVPQGSSRIISANQEANLVDTTNILFICGGSFDGIQDTVRRRINKGSSLGFGSEARKKLDDRDVYSQITDEDILEFGIIPELLGRLPRVTSTLPLTEGEMRKILTEPDNSIIKQLQALWKLDKIDLQFQPESLDRIAELASASPKGARALRSIVESTLEEYSFECPSEKDIESLVITPEAVDKTGPPIIVRTRTASNG